MERPAGATVVPLAWRIHRLERLIAHYEARGWKLALRLDARAELTGRGTRRRYIEVCVDGTLIDRALEEPGTRSSKRSARVLTGGTTTALLLVLVLGLAALGLSLNGRARSGHRDEVTRIDTSSTPTEEQLLAAEQSGDDSPDGALVQSFAGELDSLEQHCTESRGELAQFARESNVRLAVLGVVEPLLDTAVKMRKVASDQGPSRGSCGDRFSADLDRRAPAP